jgi:hypothetical protein
MEKISVSHEEADGKRSAFSRQFSAKTKRVAAGGFWLVSEVRQELLCFSVWLTAES